MTDHIGPRHFAEPVTVTIEDMAYMNQYNPIRPRVTCRDGFVMSVQASTTHYCGPRDDAGPYMTVEVGYPSMEDPLLVPYAEVMWGEGEKPDYTDCVYPYVPASVVLEVVNAHGGPVGVYAMPPLVLPDTI